MKTGDFDLFYELPDLSSCKMENNANFTSPTFLEHLNDSDKPIYIDLRNCSRNPYTLFLSNQDLNGTGEHCFGKFFKKRFLFCWYKLTTLCSFFYHF